MTLGPKFVNGPPNWNSNKVFFLTRRETDGKLPCKGHDRGLWFRFLAFANRKNKNDHLASHKIGQNIYSSLNSAIRVCIYTEHLVLLGTDLINIWKLLNKTFSLLIL